MSGPAFRILGPLQVNGPNGHVRVPPGRQQVILGALLLESGRIVSTDYLVDAIWDERPPDTARTQVQICVSRLRKSLAATDVTLQTRPPGYLLRVEDERLDMRAYDRLVAEAEVVAREGRAEEAAALLREAVGLWRGPALSGISSRVLRTKAARLDENRLNTTETYLDLELGLARHHLLIGEISALVEEYPLRERLRGQLMLALYRSGRQAEALETYRRGRDLLIDELGLEPGEELRSLESAILSGDTALRLERTSTAAAEPAALPARLGRSGGGPAGEPRAPAPAVPAARAPGTAAEGEPRPHQLPADTADFVGRAESVRAVESTLTGADRNRAIGVVVVIGRPGVGKSAMATHVAHRLMEAHFPDGQLYCDLRGSRDRPTPPAEVLGRFLRALGIPGQALPDDLDERAEMYRTLLAGRRVLVVLDDAAGENQIASLLPGSHDCGVVVTSRARLTGVPGARLVELDVLSDDQSLELLACVVGRDRVADEPAAAAALVRTVGKLPLALRIVAARLAARPHWSLASMVNRLSDERHRLDELAHGELTVRASLSLTYDGMDARARRTLRLLGLADGPSQPGWVAGALLDDRRPHPSDLMEPLVDAQMLDVTGVDANGDPRYRFHDIIRLFARERLADQETESGRVEATARLVGGWLALVDEANRRIQGGDYLFLHGSAPRWRPPAAYTEQVLADPMAWLEGEQANLCSAVAQAADADLDELCWDLASSLVTLFNRRSYLDTWEATNRCAMEAVRRRGNRRGIAALTFSAGSLYLDQRKHAEAREAMTRALEEFTLLGDLLGQAKCQRELAHLEQFDGDRQRALMFCELALTGFTEVGDVAGQGRTLLLSGHIHTSGGDPERGLADLRRALGYAEATGDPRDRAQVLRRIGQAMLRQGDRHGALATLNEAFALLRDLKDPIGEGYLLHDLGVVSGSLGRLQEARGFLGRSLAVREQILDGEGGAEVRLDLARLLMEMGESEQAAELARHARRFFTDQGMEREAERAGGLLDPVESRAAD